jgi:hypothetical protein
MLPVTPHLRNTPADIRVSLPVSRSGRIPRESLDAPEHLPTTGSVSNSLGQLEDEAPGERRVRFPLAEERKIWMQGYLDRISVTRDGLWQIHEAATGAHCDCCS